MMILGCWNVDNSEGLSIFQYHITCSASYMWSIAERGHQHLYDYKL